MHAQTRQNLRVAAALQQGPSNVNSAGLDHVFHGHLWKSDRLRYARDLANSAPIRRLMCFCRLTACIISVAEVFCAEDLPSPLHGTACHHGLHASMAAFLLVLWVVHGANLSF